MPLCNEQDLGVETGTHMQVEFQLISLPTTMQAT